MDKTFNLGGSHQQPQDQISTFTAFAVETATGLRSSVCQLSFVRVSGGVITERYTSLVQPPFNEYADTNIKEHGIIPAMTQNLPQFPILWRKVKDYFVDETIVAYCTEYDIDALTSVLEVYQQEVPYFNFICTYNLYDCTLGEACEKHGIDIEPCNKLSEAEACAKLFLINQGVKPYDLKENREANAVV